MTHSNTVSGLDNIDDLPRPAAIVRDPSVSALPRPMSSPNIADSGRISFGAGFRLQLKK